MGGDTVYALAHFPELLDVGLILILNGTVWIDPLYSAALIYEAIMGK